MRKKFWTKDDSQFTLLALPTALWFLLFSYLPMFGAIMAFKDYRISGGFLKSMVESKWAGLDNFKFLFKSGDIWLILRNTLGYNSVMIVLGVVLPVALAIIISEIRGKRLAKVYQTLLFFPYFLSWVVVSALVWAFLSYDLGIVNTALGGLGLEPRRWYMEKSFWPFFLIFMSQWKSLGYSMVVYLAAIKSLDWGIYEAALIDGASKWQQIRRITIPLMRPVIVLMFIMSVGRIFYSDFGLFYQVPRGSNSLYTVTYTLDVYVYQQLKSATTGMASAAALLQAAAACATILFTNWVVKRLDADSAMI
ncbi:MAG: ABC transporter permease subunit [Treponema sp.]|jgi:putative aldouronate transport system permease protein|nr:ABC transporter permease subunit [Treponema sp.]